ncbi:ABC transporter transmembrane region family protein, partial [Chlamydia psittaci 06-1683]
RSSSKFFDGELCPSADNSNISFSRMFIDILEIFSFSVYCFSCIDSSYCDHREENQSLGEENTKKSRSVFFRTFRFSCGNSHRKGFPYGSIRI